MPMLPFHAYFLKWLLLPVKCYSNFVSLLKNACFFTPMYDTCCWHSFSIYIEILHFKITFCRRNYFSPNINDSEDAL